MGLATQNTDDPQNTHDPGVLACLRAIVSRLREDQGALEGLPTLGAVIADLRAGAAVYSEGRPEKAEEAIRAAERTGAGEMVMSVGATDEECLRRVWARADDPRNAARRRALRQALFDSLADCWEGGPAGRFLICVNGRTGHILSALVGHDWDERNWVVQKLEQFKNAVYARARALILAMAHEAAASGDEDRRRAGLQYLATTLTEMRALEEPSEEAAEAVAGEMRAAISQMVDDYIGELEREAGLRGVIPDYMVAAVKKDAQAAVA